jgi:hypothetical protein
MSVVPYTYRSSLTLHLKTDVLYLTLNNQSSEALHVKVGVLYLTLSYH